MGRTNNQLSVVYASVPQAPRGGSLAAAAHGTIRYRRPGTHRWTRLTPQHPATRQTRRSTRPHGTVQLSNPEPHGQHPVGHGLGWRVQRQQRFKRAHHDPRRRHLGGAGAGGARAGAALAGHAKKHTSPKPVSGNLWAKGHGKFTTKGNYGAAAVLGTNG